MSENATTLTWHVGQSVAVRCPTYRTSETPRVIDGVVEKVARKYVTVVANNCVYEFDKQTRREKGGSSHPSWLYTSRAEYDAAQALAAAWARFKITAGRYHSRPAWLTTGQLNAMADLLERPARGGEDA